MLTEQRFERILERLKVKKSITVAEITEDLGISESTARRDITALDKAGKLTKVFGGAVAAEHTYEMKEPTVAQKVNVRKEEKIKIAQYAADMIGDNDFVYLDAGTSVGYMVEFLAEKRAAFVTNAVAHAQRLAAQGNRVLLIGGELKSSTEAVVGAQAIELLRKYHFTKGFKNGDYIFVPNVRKAVEEKKDVINAYVVGDELKEIQLKLGDLTDAERQIILDGCLINYYKATK